MSPRNGVPDWLEAQGKLFRAALPGLLESPARGKWCVFRDEVLHLADDENAAYGWAIEHLGIHGHFWLARIEPQGPPVLVQRFYEPPPPALEQLRAAVHALDADLELTRDELAVALSLGAELIEVLITKVCELQADDRGGVLAVLQLGEAAEVLRMLAGKAGHPATVHRLGGPGQVRE